MIFDTRNVLACHDFQYIDLMPDPQDISCHASFRYVWRRARQHSADVPYGLKPAVVYLFLGFYVTAQDLSDNVSGLAGGCQLLIASCICCRPTNAATLDVVALQQDFEHDMQPT